VSGCEACVVMRLGNEAGCSVQALLHMQQVRMRTCVFVCLCCDASRAVHHIYCSRRVPV
jgi:hypothetical protein